jgi:predicted dehydrogenase
MTDADSLPAARTPDARSAPSLRWGVLGTGWIAERFVDALQRHSSQRVVAVGSRSGQAAADFASKFGLPRPHGRYESLVEDPDVDVVYVATPHNAHLPCALLAIEAGKHTLIEKPLALDATEARAIADAAGGHGLFCMEAYWTTFLPKFDVLRQILTGPLLGEVTAVVADFGEWFPPEHRIFRRDLAGGPMLDLGTYLVNFAIDVIGRPEEILARGTRSPSGVYGQTAMILSQGVRQAVLHTTILANTPTRATIAGSRATISIDGPFYQPGGFRLDPADGSPGLRYEEERVGHQALHQQAAEVARQIADGKTSSPLRPLSSSIAALEVMDEVRCQTGDRHFEQ